ncbi:MAG: hypothetical protein ACRDO8_09610, partial [Nocardioidaceae bacterium]
MRSPRAARGPCPTAVLAVLVVPVLIAALAGCSSGDRPPESARSGTPEGSASSAAPGGFPRTVHHAMGTTTIPEKPKRIVTLDASFTEAAIALHADVVGYVNYGGTSKLPDYLGASAQRYAGDAISVGELEQPSLDRIVALHPDLIVSAKVRHADLYG